MKVSVFLSLSVFLLFSLFYRLSHAQQPYVNTKSLLCDQDYPGTSGNACNGPKKSCKSFVTFRSLPPYNTPVSIAYLLGSQASDIALINNISDVDNIPIDKQIIVPVSCSCSPLNFYQHNTPYTLKNPGETYFTIANNTYQGLTTCQALARQNTYGTYDLHSGLDLMVPVRCACPSEKQAANGVSFLMTYTITWGDSILSISEFVSAIRDLVSGVSEESIMEANELTQDSRIFPFTPILIPLKSDSCTEKPENFFCYCSNGYLADGKREGRICKPDEKGFPLKLVTLLGVSIGSGLLCLSLCSYWLYQYLMKRKHSKHKEKMYKKNGGLLLEQQIASVNGGVDQRAKIFTSEELQRATDNYNQSRILGQGGCGTVYKGMLPDGKIVAVKKSTAVDSTRIEQFINEVAILSQINHRNVVKLLGCCLETEVPLLVYEFIPNGTLSHHIHNHQDNEFSSGSSSLSWATRLRIASEVAGALSYMHSAASIPILHRDIKSSNILLDETYSAKVADFGTSRTIPYGKTHLTTTVQGTFGYLDPEYFQTSHFNEKGDVYSFGVVLVELLTGGKPISFARAEEEINLVAYFFSLLKDNKLFEIIDHRVEIEAKSEEIIAIANLASRCLRLEGKGRPTMKEVAMELEGLSKNQKCLQINQEPFIHIGAESGQKSLDIFSMEMECSPVDTLI